MEKEPIKLPEQEPMMAKSKNKFKPLAIVFIVLTVLFALAAGFFVWQWCQQKSQIETLKNDISKIQSGLDDKKDQSNKSNWLVIKEWGIKFELPASLIGDITYKKSSEYAGMWINSKKYAAKCDANTEDSERSGNIGFLERYTEADYNDAINYSEGMPPPPRINFNPINGYVFTFSLPNIGCSMEQDAIDVQVERTNQVLNMLDSLRAI